MHGLFGPRPSPTTYLVTNMLLGSWAAGASGRAKSGSLRESGTVHDVSKLPTLLLPGPFLHFLSTFSSGSERSAKQNAFSCKVWQLDWLRTLSEDVNCACQHPACDTFAVCKAMSTSYGGLKTELYPVCLSLAQPSRPSWRRLCGPPLLRAQHRRLKESGIDLDINRCSQAFARERLGLGLGHSRAPQTLWCLWPFGGNIPRWPEVGPERNRFSPVQWTPLRGELVIHMGFGSNRTLQGMDGIPVWTCVPLQQQPRWERGPDAYAAMLSGPVAIAAASCSSRGPRSILLSDHAGDGRLQLKPCGPVTFRATLNMEGFL